MCSDINLCIWVVISFGDARGVCQFMSLLVVVSIGVMVVSNKGIGFLNIISGVAICSQSTSNDVNGVSPLVLELIALMVEHVSMLHQLPFCAQVDITNSFIIFHSLFFPYFFFIFPLISIFIFLTFSFF